MTGPVSDMHRRAQEAAIRRLRTYRRASDDLADAVREAAGQEIDIVTIANEAGISRNRVYRILGRTPSQPPTPEPTEQSPARTLTQAARERGPILQAIADGRVTAHYRGPGQGVEWRIDGEQVIPARIVDYLSGARTRGTIATHRRPVTTIALSGLAVYELHVYQQATEPEEQR